MATAKAQTPAAPSTVTTITTANTVADDGVFRPKVLKQVTMPLFKLRAGSEIFVKVTGKMFLSKPIKGDTPKDGEKPKEPPTLIPVVKLDTGEIGQIIAGSVLRDIFKDEYPNDSYVGKGFWIVVTEQKEAKVGGGRRYNNYTVSEIEVPAAKK